MRATKANQAQFVFMCGTLPVDTFNVIDFTGEDKISGCYDFKVTLRSQDPDISSADILNKPASIFIYRDGQFFPYSGIVSNFNYVETSTDFSTYEAHIVPRLWITTLTYQSRVFQRQSVNQVVQQVLDESGLSNYCKFDLQNSYPQREYIVQYKETDFNFISRLLEEAGIWYFFEEAPVSSDSLDNVSNERLIISDKSDSFVAIHGEAVVPFRTKSGMIQSNKRDEHECCSNMTFERRVITADVAVKNYNYRTPDVSPHVRKNIEDGLVGLDYRYGGKFKDTDTAQKAAQLLAKQHTVEFVGIQLSSDCRRFRAGMRFTVRDHQRTECNDTFLILSVVQSGAHTSIGGFHDRATYQNHCTLLPSAKIVSFAPKKIHKPTPLYGITTAPIEANGSDYASLDEVGRYKVRMPFDVSDTANYDATKYIRLAQPYSGANYGIHFPSHEGAEMILACIDGDIDKPLGIGTVPNADTKSPVVSANKEQSVIRTAGDNEMIFDDTIDKQKVSIRTAAKNKMVYDDENKFILVQTTDGNKLLIDDKNTSTTLTSKNHNMMMSYKDGEEHITITSAKGHIIKIDDANKVMTLQTAAGHIIQMDDGGKTIVMKDCAGKNTVTLDGNKGIAMESQGKIAITAQQDVEIKGANVKVSSSQGTINLKSTTDTIVDALNVSVKGKVGYKVEATTVDLTAKTTMKAKANVSAEFSSSAMAKLSGGAMTTISGGLVKIN
jgi:type VI secretion system secreted protein VgrG